MNNPKIRDKISSNSNRAIALFNNPLFTTIIAKKLNYFQNYIIPGKHSGFRSGRCCEILFFIS